MIEAQMPARRIMWLAPAEERCIPFFIRHGIFPPSTFLFFDTNPNILWPFVVLRLMLGQTSMQLDSMPVQ